MMTVTLAPGDLGADMASFRLDNSTKVQQFKQAGGKFVLRYSAGAASSPSNPSYHLNASKLITPGEHKQLLADGFDVVANSEWYESRITEGPGAGREDAQADLALWRSCGHAKGASIYVSLDQAVPGNISGIVGYLQAYEQGLGGYYHVDCYGGTPLLRKLLASHIVKYGWRPNAGSWSGDGLPYQPSNPKSHLAQALADTPAHIWQTGSYWFGQQADENMILRVPIGSHYEALGGVAPSPRPPAPPAPHPNYPILHRPWPRYMAGGNYFGLITGPSVSHGGINAAEQADVRAIQQRLQALHFAPNRPGWADGKFEQPTAGAVTAFQHAHSPGTQYFGQVWSDDWAKLFTY